MDNDKKDGLRKVVKQLDKVLSRNTWAITGGCALSLLNELVNVSTWQPAAVNPNDKPTDKPIHMAREPNDLDLVAISGRGAMNAIATAVFEAIGNGKRPRPAGGNAEHTAVRDVDHFGHVDIFHGRRLGAGKNEVTQIDLWGQGKVYVVQIGTLIRQKRAIVQDVYYNEGDRIKAGNDLIWMEGILRYRPAPLRRCPQPGHRQALRIPGSPHRS